MNGHVFQCLNKCEDKQQLQKTVEAVGEYIAKNLKYPGDMASLCKDFKKPKIEEPEDLATTETSQLKIVLWGKRVAAYCTRTDYIESNLKSVDAVVWGQCSEAMKAKLASLDEYDDKDRSSDCVWLLQEIKGFTFRFEGQQYIFLFLIDARVNFYSYKQGQDETVSDYMAQFMSLVEVLEHYGGRIGEDKALLDAVKGHPRIADPGAGASATELVAYSNKRTRLTRDRTLALVFLRHADRRRFGTLWMDLENQFSRGNDQYPVDLTAAFSLLVNFKNPNKTGGAREPRQAPTMQTPEVTGLTFTQTRDYKETGNEVPGDDSVTHVGITCYNCQSKGHYQPNCPSTVEGVQLLQSGNNERAAINDTSNNEHHLEQHSFSFAQVDERYRLIPETWVLLDSQSTASVFNNRKFLTNIRPSAHSLKVHTNGGTQTSTNIRDVRNFGTVWFNPCSLTNILSLAAVRKICRITMDRAVEAALCVHKADGTVMKLIEYQTGLYYFDAAAASGGTNLSNTPVNAYSFVNTVTNNKKLFPTREIQGADAARELYRKLGRPSQQHFEHILNHNLIRNCPVTVDDAKRALIIYGPDAAALKGKTTKENSQHVPSARLIPVTAPILEHHSEITLCMDNFDVQGYPFFHTISRKVKFRTVEQLPNKTKPTLLNATLSVMALYHRRGFTVTGVRTDNEFACLRDDILPARLNVTAPDDHVGEVKRSIRTIKERVRAYIHGMPFKRLPKLMIQELVSRAVKDLNQFPAKHGVSGTLSPFTIMTGQPRLDYNKLKIEFGSYTQVFEDNDPTNTTRMRNTGAIALNPTGNAQGDVYFMSLVTWRRLSQTQWTPLPMSEAVIATAVAKAEAQGEPLIVGGCPSFEWRRNKAIEDEEQGDLEDERDSKNEAQLFEEYRDEDGYENNNDIGDKHFDEAHEDHENEHNAEDDEILDGDHIDGHYNDGEHVDTQGHENIVSMEQEVYDPPLDVTEDELLSENNEESRSENIADINTDSDEAVELQSANTYNLRNARECTYGHQLDHQMDNLTSGVIYNDDFQMLQATNKGKTTTGDMHHFIHGFVMTQMIASAGIKRYGQAAVDALLKEFCQLDNKNVFPPWTRIHSHTNKRRKHCGQSISLKKRGVALSRDNWLLTAEHRRTCTPKRRPCHQLYHQMH